MAAKRKLADADSAGNRPGPDNHLRIYPILQDDAEHQHDNLVSESPLQQERQRQQPSSALSVPIPLASVEHYPRKRISIACDLCRFRKTKCDAARPTCGFCANLGVRCQYRESATNGPREYRPRPGKAVSRDRDDPDLSGFEKRLLELESKWAGLEKQNSEIMVSSSTAASSFFSADTASASALPSSSAPLNALSIGPSPPASNITGSIAGIQDFSFVPIVARPSQSSLKADSSSGSAARTVTRARYNAEYLQRLPLQPTEPCYVEQPTLLAFGSTRCLQVDGWDDSGEFYDSEMAAGNDFNQQVTACLETSPDVSKRTVRLLLQSFVENFLGWMPIFEPASVYTIVNDACTGCFPPNKPESALAMLILATGALLQNHADVRISPLPGFDYFAHGNQYLQRFSFFSGSLTVIHCRILQAAYFKASLHALLSWNAITRAVQDCMSVFSSQWWTSLDSRAREPWHRAFWACSIIADEHEASMRLHTVGHRMYGDIVPLPRFENEDTGFYYFLAQIGLRKLVTKAFGVAGYHGEAGSRTPHGKILQVLQVPMGTEELRSQVRQWHAHLPVAIRFPLDSSPLFDSRKSFLRLQYFSLSMIIDWASVLRVIEAHGTDREGSEEIASARLEAAEFFQFCTLYISVAAEQLLDWRLGTFVSLWSAFVCLASLIVCYRVPALAFIPATGDERPVRNALELLQPWIHIPFAALGVDRMLGLMEKIGILP